MAWLFGKWKLEISEFCWDLINGRLIKEKE